MTDDAKHPDEQLLRALSQEASGLVGRLAGPVKRVALQAGDYRVEVEWEAPVAGAVEIVRERPTAEPAKAAEEVPGRHAVVAPLVGTFYRCPEPGAKPFAAPGEVVEADQPVAIIEAMKIMNKIVAGVGGRVTEILVGDADWVEFEQALMYIEPLEPEEA
jgi:acetyl-CoA carboxylase biotin carboxyl carrier protein